MHDKSVDRSQLPKNLGSDDRHPLPGNSLPTQAFAPQVDDPALSTAGGVSEATVSLIERVASICQDYQQSVESGRNDDFRQHLIQLAEEDQPTLLRNLLEFDIFRLRKLGQAPTPQTYIDLLPEFDALIRRVFLDTSSVSIAARSLEELPETGTFERSVVTRLGEYRLVRELGRGGMARYSKRSICVAAIA